MGTHQLPSKPSAILGPRSPKPQNWLLVLGLRPRVRTGVTFLLMFIIFLNLFGCAGFYLQHADYSVFTAHTGSFVVAYKPLVAAYGTWLHQELNPGPLCWECGVLATGPPEKSLDRGSL